jgi:ferric-dicitrate binding protein FerR (iron transport regulator)
MDTAPFESLLDRYQSGEATTDDLDELDRHLRADAGKRRILVERTLLEVQLRKFFGGLAPTPQGRRASAAWRLPVRWWMIAIALVLAALGLYLVMSMRGAVGPGATVESGIVRVNGAATAIVPTQTPFEVGGQIPGVLRLPDGAHAELDTGTRAVLHGGNHPRRIEVIRGGGEFAVAPGQAPLRIDTPIGTAVAESAQFTARLSTAANGGTTWTVVVRAGTVEVQAGGETLALAAGAQRVFVGAPGP